MKFQRIAIFDIDNCISDDRDRLKLIDMSLTGNERYAAYHAAHAEDRPDELALNKLVSHALQGHRIVFITGRPEEHRNSTMAWLGLHVFEKHSLTHDYDLYMRPMEGPLSCLTSNALKPAIIKELAKIDVAHIEHAYDDFDSVLRAYTALGIPCSKLAAHTGDSHNQRGDHEDRRAFEPLAVADLEHTPGPATDFAASAPRTAADILDSMAATYRERNSVYGSNYLMVAKLVAVLFPNGVPPELVVTDHWHLFELKLVKLSRFAISNLTHVDSIHDDGVYSAMIQAILEK